MGRILAIDYGKKRVGLATTDPLQLIASALTTVAANETMAYLKAYCDREEVERFVVGLPRRWNNDASEVESAIQAFVGRLKKQFPAIPVDREDERFTSLLATRAIRDSGVKKKDRQNKGLVDQVSATIILQSYLERKNNAPGRPNL
ncbi:MAG: Holliday junction resolvase RuvX [Salibacteraceae bacterium]